MSEDKSGKCPVTGTKSEAGGCPVKMGSSSSTKPPVSQSSEGAGGGLGACPMQGANPPAPTGRGCPVSPNNVYKWFTGYDLDKRPPANAAEPYKNPKQYNVYSQEIDPSNQMPTNLNNTKLSPDQAEDLSSDRVASNIPKGGADLKEDGTSATWTYPSPQMFWNSLVRKGKVEGAKEEDMDVVVAVHNNMNERTWSEVMKWEALKGNGMYIGGEPKLLRFMGKPFDLSIKARLKMLFGHPAPFDRHDWWVDQGGRINRYIIDYYHDESSSKADERPSSLTDVTSMKSIMVDVRPAMFDNFFGLYSRLFVMPFKRLVGMTTFTPLPFFAPSRMTQGEKAQKERLAGQWKEIEEKCSAAKARLKGCQSDEECGAAAVALQRCTASVVCPDTVAIFDRCIEATKGGSGKDEAVLEDELQDAFKGISNCLNNFEIECRSAKQQ